MYVYAKEDIKINECIVAIRGEKLEVLIITDGLFLLKGKTIKSPFPANEHLVTEIYENI